MRRVNWRQATGDFEKLPLLKVKCWVVRSAAALLGLDAVLLVLLDLHSHFWMDAPWVLGCVER